MWNIAHTWFLARLLAYLSYLFYFPDSWLSVLNDFDFYFWWRDSENRELPIHGGFFAQDTHKFHSVFQHNLVCIYICNFPEGSHTFHHCDKVFWYIHLHLKFNKHNFVIWNTSLLNFIGFIVVCILLNILHPLSQLRSSKSALFLAAAIWRHTCMLLVFLGSLSTTCTKNT